MNKYVKEHLLILSEATIQGNIIHQIVNMNIVRPNLRCWVVVTFNGSCFHRFSQDECFLFWLNLMKENSLWFSSCVQTHLRFKTLTLQVQSGLNATLIQLFLLSSFLQEKRTRSDRTGPADLAAALFWV